MRDGWVSVWWQAAVMPRRWLVCGIRTPPLTVWHAFALESIGNPYLCGGPIDENACAALLLFSGLNRRDGLRLLWDDHYRVRRMRRVLRKLRGKTIKEIHAACSEYVDVCTRGASRWRKGEGKPCAVPFAWHAVARLGDRAWDMPYVEARCLFDALAEQAGDDSIMSDKAQEMEDNWTEYEQIAALSGAN